MHMMSATFANARPKVLPKRGFKRVLEYLYSSLTNIWSSKFLGISLMHSVHIFSKKGQGGNDQKGHFC